MASQSRIDKLRAMAHQTDSPHEAAIAKRRLEAMGEPLEAPPRVTVDEMTDKMLNDFFGRAPRRVPSPYRPVEEGEVVIRMNGKPVRRVPGPFGE